MSSAPLPPQYHLALAGAPDSVAVDRLRLMAYEGATNFRLTSASSLSVAADPPGSQVFCAWAGATLVATVRLSTATTPEQAEELLGVAPPLAPPLPAAVFSRGAVHPEHQGQGWMPLMLTVGLGVARRQRHASALGVQAAGTGHQRSMLRAGWRMRDLGPQRYGMVALPSTLQFLWLDRAGFDPAVACGREKAAGLVARCAVPRDAALGDALA